VDTDQPPGQSLGGDDLAPGEADVADLANRPFHFQG
jgi:hypothetical protein